MEHHTIRKWAVNWLLLVCAVHVAAGALLPWVGGATLFDGYHSAIESAFWPGGAPLEARGLQTWWIALFGPTIQAMALFMLALVRLADRLRQPSIWLWLIAGLAVWAPQDMLVSLRADCWPHVAADAFALLVMLPPLVWLWVKDRRGATGPLPPASGGSGHPSLAPGAGTEAEP
jgi:hypothetical protein